MHREPSCHLPGTSCPKTSLGHVLSCRRISDYRINAKQSVRSPQLGKTLARLVRWTYLQDTLRNDAASGGIEIKPCWRANNTRSALLFKLNDCIMWCLWNSMVFSLKFR
jgi:hypothetical protein